MCDKRSTRKITIDGRTFRVDACLAELIYALNQNGIETLGCCCGHGRYPMTIVHRSVNGNIYDFVSGWGIPRETRFYLTDDEGYYYLPEVVARG